MPRVRTALLALAAGAWLAIGPAYARAAPPIPVIVDADVGDDIDDAFAIALAVSDPRLQVLGVTTAWGDVHLRARLTRRLLAAAGRPDIPISEGVATATTTPFTQAQWASHQPDAPAPDAVAWIADQARRRPGEITLVELAPMTNLAALIQRFPDALPKLKRVVFMGGSVHVGYANTAGIPDAKPSAEYNIAVQAQAFAAVLSSGVPLVMFPLDSTQLKFDEVRRDRLFAHSSALSDALALLYHQWRVGNGWGQITPTLFDAIPVVWLLDPQACPVQPLRIAVDAKGFTRLEPGAPNLQACLTLHEDAAQALILDTLSPAGDLFKR